ncbi:unnamed protein product [Closterium sp. NIES-54]
MDAEMASWKSTGTYVDEVPPPGANIISGMWVFRVKRPPGSPPVFKARYVARGFSQRQGVDYFQTFSPTPKMTTLRVLLHVCAQRDYELHSLDFSTAFLQGSLHEEIWLRRPPGFTGSFPPGTQWSLWRPVYGLRQAPREWHDTLRTTLAALGFSPSTADPSLFFRTNTLLPPFYVLVYVDDLVFATADTAGLAHVKSELQKRHTCTDLGELRSYLGLQITRDRARRTITLTQSHMVQQVLQRFDFTYSSPQATPLSTRHSLSALPSDESVEPSGPYPELGYQQKEKVDYKELFAPVVKPTTLRTLLAGAAIKGRVVKQMDVTTAFLNGVLEEEIFMAHPEGFDDGSGRVPRLKKVLYGLKQATRQRYLKLRGVLEEIGFTPSSADHSLFMLGEGEQRSFMVVYVDDILIFSPSYDLVKEVMLKLQDKFKCKALGDVSFYLGLHIERDVEKRCMRVHQRKYLEALAATFGQIQGHVATPFPSGFKCVKGPEEESVGEEERRRFHSLVGSLMVAKYLGQTSTVGLQYSAAAQRRQKGADAVEPRHLFLTAFSDASYASEPEDMTSVGGFICCVGGGPTAWESKKQVDQALSLVESEYMALFRAVREIVWQRRLLAEFGEEQQGPTPLYCDSQGAIALAKNPVLHGLTKHMRVKWHWTRSMGAAGEVELHYVKTTRQPADMMTKRLKEQQHWKCLHIPSFSTNLVSTAALQDAMVTTTTLGGQCVSICTCTQTGRHLATFTRRPGSSLYTLATKPSQVATSAQVSASGPVATPCSCRLLSHQTLLWHHRLGHPSLPRLRGMHSRLLVSGLPRSLPPLLPSPAPPCLVCVEERQRAAPHSSFPPTIAPLQTLHMDVWGPACVSGQGRERYFLLVVDHYTSYTTVFPLCSKGEVLDVLIPWIRAVRLQLRKRFHQDLPVLRLHSDRGVMEVARTSMIHAAALHFLWPFAVRYAAHQLNLWPRVSLPKTSPTLRWTGEVGDASVFREVTFDELVPFYHLFPYRSTPPPPWPLFLAPGPPLVDPLPPQGPAPSGVSQVDPLPDIVPVEVVVDTGAARGAASWDADPGVAESEGAGSGGAEPGGAEPGGAEPAGVEPGGAEPEGVDSGGADSKGAVSGGAEPWGTSSSRGPAGASPRLYPRPEPLFPQQLREWFAQRIRLWSGAARAGDSAAGDTGARGVGATRLGGAGVTAGAGGNRGSAAAGPGGARTRGTGAAWTSSVGVAGARGAGAGDPPEPGAGGAGAGDIGAVGAGAGGTGACGAGAGGAGAGDPGGVDPGAGGAGAGGAVFGGTGVLGTVRPPPFFVPLLRQPGSPLPAPSSYAEKTLSFIERRELESRPASPGRAVRIGRQVPRPRPPPVPGTHAMALRPSTVPLHVPLPPPPESSLPAVTDPESDLTHAASPSVSCLLATVVTDPSFESTVVFALVAELV